MKSISEIIAERVLKTVTESAQDLLNDTTVPDQVHGDTAINLLRLLAVTKPTAPTQQAMVPVAAEKSDADFVREFFAATPPQRRFGIGMPKRFTDDIIQFALDRRNGNIKRASRLLGCSYAIVHTYVQRQRKSVNGAMAA